MIPRQSCPFFLYLIIFDQGTLIQHRPENTFATQAENICLFLLTMHSKQLFILHVQYSLKKIIVHLHYAQHLHNHTIDRHSLFRKRFPSNT